MGAAVAVIRDVKFALYGIYLPPNYKRVSQILHIVDTRAMKRPACKRTTTGMTDRPRHDTP